MVGEDGIDVDEGVTVCALENGRSSSEELHAAALPEPLAVATKGPHATRPPLKRMRRTLTEEFEVTLPMGTDSLVLPAIPLPREAMRGRPCTVRITFDV